MTKEEWVSFYERKSGAKLVLHEGELIFFHPDHGILSFLINPEDECLECHHIAGDGKFWQGQIIAMLKQSGLKRARFFTRRNPKAWIRRYGGRIRGYYMEVDLDETKV